MKLVVGSDHAAYELKEAIKEKLISEGHEVIDVGCDSTESVDYPKYGHAVGRAVASGEAERGIAVCGSGIGISIACNKVPGIRAALCDAALGLAGRHCASYSVSILRVVYRLS